jgi:hypothetical protein
VSSETLPGSLTGKKFTQRSSSRESAVLQKIIRSEAVAMEIYAARASNLFAAAPYASRRAGGWTSARGAQFRLSPDL